VVNSAALRLLGIDHERGDVVGGVVERDAASHEPTGLLKESACDRVASLSIGSDATRRACITRGLRECLQRGITAVQTNDGGAWPLYAALAKEEALPLRVFLTVQAHEVGTPSAPPPGSRVGELLSCHRAKIFADGSLGADTAALSEPYQHLRAGEEEDEEEDGPAAKAPAAKRARSAPRECDHAHAALGVLVHAREPLRALVARTHAAGFRLEVHVIGDRAADEVLGALEAAGAGPAARPILTHCQVLRGDLIARMRALGAVANVQPQFVASDARWVDKKLSAALRPFAYAWRTLLREGVIVAGGSDAPIERADPLEGMHVAVFRFLQGTASPWRPEEALSREEALHIYTVGGALAAQEEARLGRVAPGMAADLVVLGVDAWAEPARLAACPVEQVWVAGRRRL
jgi:predicted amidohydrolase YtcJ